MLLRLMTLESVGREVIIYARDENLVKHRIRVSDFYPYFYRDRMVQDKRVVKIEKGFKSFRDEDLYKIYVNHPGTVPKIREEGDMEADIPYIRRFLIDIGLTDYFTIPDSAKVNDLGEIFVSYKDIKPEEVEGE